METIEFYRDRKKTINLLLICGAVTVALLGIILYCSGLFTDEMRLKPLIAATAIMLFVGYFMISSIIGLNDPSPMIILNQDGIITKTTPVSKAAGLLKWDDVQDVTLQDVGSDTLVNISLNNAPYYESVIKKKMSASMLEGAIDERGYIRISMTASETAIEAPELLSKINAYRSTLTAI